MRRRRSVATSSCDEVPAETGTGVESSGGADAASSSARTHAVASSPPACGVFPRNRFGSTGVALACALLAATTATAGSRARYGGALKIVAVTKSPKPNANGLVDASVAALTTTPLCRAVEISRPSATVLRLVPRAPFSVRAVAVALSSAQRPTRPTSALLSQVAEVREDANGVSLLLRGAWPDADRSLCHPALAIAGGPFTVEASASVANSRHPDGRPYVDSITVQVTDERQALRLLSQRRAHVVVGAGKDVSGPALLATFLLRGSSLDGAFAQAVEAAVDRDDLTRFFVPAPSAPMPGLLPVSLGGPASAPVAQRPAPVSPPREVVLLYDAARDEQRAVAARLQVKLQPLGYRVAPRPVASDALLEAWRTGSFDLMLLSSLLPPSPLAALQVSVSLGRAPASALAPVQQALQLPAEAERDARAVALAAQLGPATPATPLFVQGLPFAAAPEVRHLTRDAQGLLRLDDVFLAEE